MFRSCRLFFAALVIMIFVAVPVFAAEGPFGLQGWGVIGLGAVLTGILSVIAVRGNKDSVIGGYVGNIRNTFLSKDVIDKAVERVLGKLGVPEVLADKIGDLSAIVLWDLPHWLSRKDEPGKVASSANFAREVEVASSVKAALVRDFADSHPAEVATLLPGLPHKAYLARSNRIRVAERLARDVQVDRVIAGAIRDAQDPALSKQSV